MKKKKIGIVLLAAIISVAITAFLFPTGIKIMGQVINPTGIILIIYILMLMLMRFCI